MLAATANTDYLALLAALRAVGPSLGTRLCRWHTSPQSCSPPPLDDGWPRLRRGGLLGTLTLAGVSGHDALAATLLDRIASYWLPLPEGAVAYALFRRHYAAVRLERP